MNLSTPRLEGRGLPSTRSQAEGLKVHPEPRFVPAFKGGPPDGVRQSLRAVERVKSLEADRRVVIHMGGTPAENGFLKGAIQRRM